MCHVTVLAQFQIDADMIILLQADTKQTAPIQHTRMRGEENVTYITFFLSSLFYSVLFQTCFLLVPYLQTFVNNSRIPEQEYVALNHMDSIRLGQDILYNSVITPFYL